jgi:hypothetical protein
MGGVFTCMLAVGAYAIQWAREEAFYPFAHL